MKKQDVKIGDFVKHSPKRNLTLRQKSVAMQVMETYAEVMTVKTIEGCFTAPYDYFEKVDNLSDFKHVAYFPDLKEAELKQINLTQ